RAGCRDKEVRSDIRKMLEMFPRLGERKRQLAGTMSGGEQQMLAIARALMSNPEILLMDEPSLGLAPLIVEEVGEVIKSLNSDGKTILLVEQNAQMALNVSHRAYVLEVGEIALQGNAAEIAANEQVKEAYLGA
ncbi:MAG: ATP-binding cassette domain-containing protein, partial [Firmicutes bacterium]|nr:ATP-binding cassette domain-containing protein [Bacillota bacterium]